MQNLLLLKEFFSLFAAIIRRFINTAKRWSSYSSFTGGLVDCAVLLIKL